MLDSQFPISGPPDSKINWKSVIENRNSLPSHMVEYPFEWIGLKMAKTDAAPWIGMPVQMDPGSDKQYLDRRYSEAVAAAGGVPILIPLIAISYLNPLH
jgi:hypothetical protein